MKKFSQTIKQASASRFLNAWRIQFGSRRFLITPAHVAVYKKHDRWLISNFLRDFKHLNWFIPAVYLANFKPEDDLAWTEVPPDSEGTFLDLSTDAILYPTNVDFYFRQPYNAEGKWVDNSSFASITSVLYPSPESALLEAIDVGFRGMSGAIALKQETTELVGMFVRRGAALGLKEGAEVPKFAHHRTKETIAEHSSATTPSLSPELKILCEYFNQKFERIEKKMDYLLQDALMKHDLNQLLGIVALRRGLVLPSHAIMKHIETSPAVELRKFAKLQED